MPELVPPTIYGVNSTAKLLALVSVEHAERVRCGQPNCGHSVYRRIHVVREHEQLLVLGSTCLQNGTGLIQPWVRPALVAVKVDR